jgi:hypothetical protein
MTGEPVRGPLAGHLLTPQDWALIVIDCQPPHLMKMALAGGGGRRSSAGRRTAVGPWRPATPSGPRPEGSAAWPSRG